MRRHEWRQVHPTVYVDHTGPLTWLQRAWAAVLLYAPAALSHVSALRALDGPGRRDRVDSEPIHVAVDRTRTVRRHPGVVVHQLGQFQTKAQWNTSPPRVRVEHAVLDVASTASDEMATIAELANAVQSRRTTAERLMIALSDRTRIPQRALMSEVLADVAQGACSALEHIYLTRVERDHALPRAERQVRDSLKGPIYRDVVYAAFMTVVELNGRLWHDDAASWDADFERDLDTALHQQATLRLGWGQARVRPCATAAKVGRILQARGWQGTPRRCPECP